ncbi:hypothetical protein BIV57_00825 [Mangrovactinospora gilvigrisea]|uniref:Transcriptional regulator LacI/GalR-like sensor domain-containing protein n=1 Tax=Mangrovactinospora gilvigrisea TaxID=1428644 RepID=A0A1J7C110_9ACTN|nr:hypothetical protein BIV57_00825 [Mangrovactinospora gilvigrisea]
MLSAAAEQQMEIAVFDVESAALRHHLIDSLPLTQRVDALVVMGVALSDRFANRLLHDQVPTVLVGTCRGGFSSVTADARSGGRLVADYLLAHGHRRLAWISEAPSAGDDATPPLAMQGRERLAGFCEGLAAAGLDLPAARRLSATHSVEGGRTAADQLLGLDEPPTAVFAYDDVLAAGVLKAARERRVAVPDALAVVGFDDVPFADPLGLTTVHQPLFEAGRSALRLLRDRLADGPHAAVHSVTTEYRIIARETT